MTELINCLRAKSKREDIKNYLLKDHLKETIKRALQLRKFVEKNKNSIAYEFDNKFFEKLVKASFLHDLGKISWNFQLEVYDKEERIWDEKNRKYTNDEFDNLYRFFESIRGINIKDHEILSLIYSLIFLDNSEDDKEIRTAVLLHHYNEFFVNREINARILFDEYPDLEKYLDFLIKKEGEIKKLLINMIDYILNDQEIINDELTKKVLENLKRGINFDKIKKLKSAVERGVDLSLHLKLYTLPEREDKIFYDFFLFLGCLRRCDYSASGNFSVEEINKLEEIIYKDLENKIKGEINKKEIWQENKEEINKKEIWQEKIVDLKNSNKLILVAPTGSGKTEFALLWAKKRGKKIIYTLPLRVALNDLFENRFRKYFHEEKVGLLHSTSFIEYLKKEEYSEEVDVETKTSIAETFSIPVLLSTPDQVFLSSLKYYGFDKVISVYPLSSIVIDEIQAYNPEMAAVIIKTLKIIEDLKGDILVITATFPPYFRSFFEKYDFVDVKDFIENNNLISEEKVKNYSIGRHKIKLIDEPLFKYSKEKNDKNYSLELLPKSFNKIEEIIKNNRDKNIMIIVNNVSKAIKLYQSLEKNETENNLYLLHSRVIEKEKSRRISGLKDGLKNGKKGLILVATQIVEASVDVDFDILVTEISPIDSQIQRWGRIWRNRNEDYKENKPNIYIFTGIDKGTLTIYHPKEVLEKTIEVLKEKEEKILNYVDERKIKRVFI